MVDPVVATDGHSYERAAIQAILDLAQGGSALSPLTREGLGTSLVPNINLRKRIQEHDNEVESVAQQVLASVQGANALALACAGGVSSGGGVVLGGMSSGGGGGVGGWAAGAVAHPWRSAHLDAGAHLGACAHLGAGAVVSRGTAVGLPASARSAVPSASSIGAAPPAVGSEAMAAMLASLNLQRYAKAFDEHGYDSWTELVFEFSEAQITKLASTIGMASNHLDRLRTALAAERRNHLGGVTTTAERRNHLGGPSDDPGHRAVDTRNDLRLPRDDGENHSGALHDAQHDAQSEAPSWALEGFDALGEVDEVGLPRVHGLVGARASSRAPSASAGAMEDGVVAGADVSLATPMEDGVVAGAAPPTPGDAAEAGGGSAHDDAQCDETDAAAPKRGAVPGTQGDETDAAAPKRGAVPGTQGDETDSAAPKWGAVPGTRSEGSSRGIPEQSILPREGAAAPRATRLPTAPAPREGAAAAGAAVGAMGVGLRTRDGRKREHPDEPSAQLGAQPSAQLGASTTGPAAGQPVASNGRARKSRRALG
jgi:hypothetical protein